MLSTIRSFEQMPTYSSEVDILYEKLRNEFNFIKEEELRAMKNYEKVQKRRHIKYIKQKFKKRKFSNSLL